MPTFRKAYIKPYEELITTFLLGALKFAIGMLALENFTLTTALYPASLVFMNSLFIALVLMRRKQLC